ncbi:MAG: hypothetical protein ACJ763_03620 [Bdellovibrionia bacterium]
MPGKSAVANCISTVLSTSIASKAADLKETLKILSDANPNVAFIEHPGLRALVVKTKNPPEVYMLPYASDGTIVHIEEYSATVRDLLGKDRASVEDVLKALSQKHGLSVPEGFGAKLKASLVQRHYVLANERMAVMSEIRSSLDPLFSATLNDFSQLDKTAIDHKLAQLQTTNRKFVLKYNQEDIPEVPHLEYSPSGPWKRLELLMKSTFKRNGSSYHLASTMGKEVESFQGRYKEFLITFPVEGHAGAWDKLGRGSAENERSVAWFLYSTVTPIGEYGSEFAHTLQATTKILMEKALERSDLGAEITQKHESVFKSYIARGKDSGSAAATNAMIEGILSLQQAITQLLPKKLESSADYRKALHDIIFPAPGKQNGTLNDYVQRVSMGTTGPLTLHGAYFQHPLVEDSGNIKLSEGLKNSLSNIRKSAIDQLTSRRGMDDKWTPGQTGLGCPFGFGTKTDPKSPIQKLAENYYRVFVEVDRTLRKTAK